MNSRGSCSDECRLCHLAFYFVFLFVVNLFLIVIFGDIHFDSVLLFWTSNFLLFITFVFLYFGFVVSFPVSFYVVCIYRLVVFLFYNYLTRLLVGRAVFDSLEEQIFLIVTTSGRVQWPTQPLIHRIRGAVTGSKTAHLQLVPKLKLRGAVYTASGFEWSVCCWYAPGGRRRQRHFQNKSSFSRTSSSRRLFYLALIQPVRNSVWNVFFTVFQQKFLKCLINETECRWFMCVAKKRPPVRVKVEVVPL
jgi:hypothetical protein